MLLVAACSDSDDVSRGDGGRPDGSTAGKGGGGAISCGKRERCEPLESFSLEHCACSADGVHMRLGPLSEGFYAQPWPLDTRLRANGLLDLGGFPTPPAALFINANLPAIEGATRGFSTTGAIFASFDGELDPDSFPRPQESLEPAASAYLLEVEPDSDTRGERVPITCSFRRAATAYNPANLLACVPVAGFALRPAARYALVLTDGLRDARGERVRDTQRVRDLLGAGGEDDAVVGDLRDAYQPLADWLAESAQKGELDHVVGATVFTTQDPTKELRALAADVQAQDAPVASSIATYDADLPAESGNYLALHGTYPTPIYQQGQTPYAASGGDIRFGADGKPVLAGELQVRFALTVPQGPMPANGWPVVLYHHGTGGDCYSFINDGTAHHLAAAGVAAIGIDAPVHGTRKPAADSADLLFFNISNVLAMRDNIRQGAVDLLVLERFVTAFSREAPGPWPVVFDADNVFAMGHSQGGLTVPLMLPLAEHVRGAMLSGAGGSITASILYKTAPLDIPELARAFLALEADEPLDAFHPVLALVQAFSDVADTTNYAPYLFRWDGGRGVDVWATQGLEDVYAPKQATDALVTALGLQPMGRLFEPVDGLELLAIDPGKAPLRANVEAASGGKFTGAYTQYAFADHFLIMNNKNAEAQLEHWFESMLGGEHGELIAP